MKKFIILLANSQRYFIHALRITLFIALSVIGGVNTLSQHHSFFIAWGVLMGILGILMLVGIWFHKIGLLGGLLIALMSLVQFVFSIVLLSGDMRSQEYLFYRLSGSGQLIIVLITGLICASDSAKQIFRQYVLRMGKA